jgi:hypothetical protein
MGLQRNHRNIGPKPAKRLTPLLNDNQTGNQALNKDPRLPRCARNDDDNALDYRRTIASSQAACFARLARLRSWGSRWTLRRRMLLGVTSTSSSSSI